MLSFPMLKQTQMQSKMQLKRVLSNKMPFLYYKGY